MNTRLPEIKNNIGCIEMLKLREFDIKQSDKK